MIRIYDGRGSNTPLHTIGGLHKSPVHVLAVRPPFLIYPTVRPFLTLYSTPTSTTQSSPPTLRVSSNTGNRKNRGSRPQHPDSGPSNPRQTCTNLKSRARPRPASPSRRTRHTLSR